MIKDPGEQPEASGDFPPAPKRRERMTPFKFWGTLGMIVAVTAFIIYLKIGPSSVTQHPVLVGFLVILAWSFRIVGFSDWNKEKD